MGIVFISYIILKNGIEVFQYNEKEILVIFESPYFLKIDKNEEFDLGLTYLRLKDTKDLTKIKEKLNLKYVKNIKKSQFDIVNILSGYYLPETLSYSSVKFFIPEKDSEIINILEKISFNNFKGLYEIDLQPVQGFFFDSESIEWYLNIPPDVNSNDYIVFRIFMKYLENIQIPVRYSRFGKKIPFFIKLKSKDEVIKIFKEGIELKDFKNALNDFYKEYKEIKNDEILLNIFLSVSGLNRWNFFEEWERRIKKVNINDIENFKFKYISGGIFLSE